MEKIWRKPKNAPVQEDVVPTPQTLELESKELVKQMEEVKVGLYVLSDTLNSMTDVIKEIDLSLRHLTAAINRK